MIIADSIETLKKARNSLNDVAFIPTMGYLHDGHLALVNAAKKTKRPVIVSIFVNPLQFGPTEDFEHYPRSFETDCAKLAAAGVDIVFAPPPDVLYPKQQTCFLDPTSQHDILEGKLRPGHFTGVATVVMKLFHLVAPKTVFFGKKDYQQLSMIRDMVEEFNMDIEIVGVNTVRDTDGLAMSSRNAYLTEDERKEAPFLYNALQEIKRCLLEGDRNYDLMSQQATDSLIKRGWQVDYIAIRPQNQLQLDPSVNQPLVILAAAKLGSTRLIDNIEVNV